MKIEPGVQYSEFIGIIEDLSNKEVYLVCEFDRSKWKILQIWGVDDIVFRGMDLKIGDKLLVKSSNWLGGVREQYEKLNN